MSDHGKHNEKTNDWTEAFVDWDKMKTQNPNIKEEIEASVNILNKIHDREVRHLVIAGIVGLAMGVGVSLWVF